MGKVITINCPLCEKSLKASCYRDPAVGINFDFDELEGSECICDADDEKRYEAQADKLEDAWESEIGYETQREYEEEHQ